MTCLFSIPSDLQSGAIAAPKNKEHGGDISDKCKQALHKTVYSWALKQDVGNTGFPARGVSAPGMKKH